MARDKRLWVKVSTDIGRHPKMANLSDAAFRAYIEALAHAKELNRDGFVPKRDARRWMPEFDELLTNDPERPSVIAVDGGYLIHDFTAHQETAEAVKRRQEASRENGAKGGRPPKPRNLDGNPAGGARRKAESRVQSPEGSTYVSESPSSNHTPDSGTDSVSRSILKGRGIAPDRLITHIKARTGIDVGANAAMKVALDILERAGQVETTDQQYVLGAITRSPAETEQFIYENGLAT